MSANLTNLSDEAQSLSRVSLFKRLEPHELEHLAEEVDQVQFKAGEVIFNEHDRGDALYVVDEGSVRIWVMDEDVKPVTLAELKPGEFFGELAVLDRGERSTNASALVDSTLHRLSSDDFQQFLMEHPDCAIDVICEIGTQFDPYPYILLNLMLSMTAALQAPIIMMSQNRAAEKDRLAAEQDFKVNLKSELMLEELIRKQRARDAQIDHLNNALAALEKSLQKN